MAITLTWHNHATVLIEGSHTIVIDPWKIPPGSPQADVVVVSHSHYDHLSLDDVKRLAGETTAIVATPDCHAKLQSFSSLHALAAGKIVEVNGVSIEGVPAYNPDKAFHPKANAWCGVVIAMDGKRLYSAGDTDFVPEMKDLADVDVAFMPVGGTYTMDWKAAADAVNAFRPKLAVPVHWGDIVGSRRDADRFAERAECDVRVLQPGESMQLNDE